MRPQFSGGININSNDGFQVEIENGKIGECWARDKHRRIIFTEGMEPNMLKNDEYFSVVEFFF